MKVEKVLIEILERGDIVLTPAGLGQVVESEEIEHYIQAGSYYKTVRLRWLESTEEHPNIGSMTHVDRGACTYDWSTKEEDIEKVKKHIK